MTRGDEQLRRLQEPAFERLWKRARQRLEREPGAVESGRVQFNDLENPERIAIGGLLGRPLRGTRASVGLSEVDEILRHGPLGIGIAAFLARIGGPLRDRPSESEAERAAVDLLATALRRAKMSEESWFEPWIGELLGRGRLLALEREGQGQLAALAAKVFDALPAADLPIALFASRILSDAKALNGTPLDRLMLHGLARRAGVERSTGADRRRWLWERVGVIPDDLASQVLVLNLRPTGNEPLAGWLRGAAGLPFRITLHQIVRCGLVFQEPGEVFVCENPAIVRAAAERLGARSRPLICTEGRPGIAFWRVYEAIAAAGGRFAVRADFDAAGLQIVGELMARGNAVPWRYDAETYRRAALGSERELRAGVVPATPWDPALSVAMAAERRFVEEEELIGGLLAELAIT